jgi:hypothetical protein
MQQGFKLQTRSPVVDLVLFRTLALNPVWHQANCSASKVASSEMWGPRWLPPQVTHVKPTQSPALRNHRAQLFPHTSGDWTVLTLPGTNPWLKAARIRNVIAVLFWAFLLLDISIRCGWWDGSDVMLLSAKTASGLWYRCLGLVFSTLDYWPLGLATLSGVCGGPVLCTVGHWATTAY